MRVLVIGSGGREHTLVWKLAQSPHVGGIYCAPGNAGTGREFKCQNVPIAVDDIPSLVTFADREKIDLTVVGPELPLVMGIVDLWPQGLRIFGPTAERAELERSKVYTKLLMRELGVPTAHFKICECFEEAYAAITHFTPGKCLVKADGICGGKGAFPCQNRRQAAEAAGMMLVQNGLGEAGKRIVVEDYLDGWEASLMVLVSAAGELIPLELAQDYKPALDDNKGTNTGGMGAYSPVERFTDAMVKEALDTIVRPIVAATGFRGVLYVGLMMTKDGMFVLELNVRFGDPETQVQLPRMKTDLFELLYSGAEGKFSTTEVEWFRSPAVTVVMAAEGYPEKPRKGDVITGLELALENQPELMIFHAGTALNEEGNIIVNGGRVLDVTALGMDRQTAREKVYRAARLITWPGEKHRTDIAA